MVGRAAVTTVTAECTQCAAGKYQDVDSEQLSECLSCFTGSYAAGAHSLICQFDWNLATAAAVAVVSGHSELGCQLSVFIEILGSDWCCVRDRQHYVH